MRPWVQVNNHVTLSDAIQSQNIDEKWSKTFAMESQYASKSQNAEIVKKQFYTY